MQQPSPKMYKYSKSGAILTVGIDRNGRIFSSIEKNGHVLASDLYVKFPTEAILAKQGWTRYHE
jgi:hypothetical protein